MRLDMMPRQPANRMSQRPENGDHARLKTDKADNLVNQHNVVRCQADLIKLVLGFIVDDVRRAGKLAGILGNLRQAAIAFA
jgi:hypothetical protein